MNLDVNYDEILQRMLRDVSDDVDKREGSVVYSAMAPTAVELQNVYIQLKYLLEEFFVVTATRERLIKRAVEWNMKPHEATKAKLKGVFNIDVPIGSRFSLEELNYVVTEKIGTGEFLLECETAGEEGNLQLGTLIPIEYINNLQTAELTELLLPAIDEEDTEAFRERLLEVMRLPATSGNKAHYKIWAREVAGVGDAKIIPTWNGGGTVKVVVIDNEKRASTPELNEKVYRHIEENRPINAEVTVVSATEKKINVTAKVVLANGYNISQVQSAFTQALNKHFSDLAFKETYVSNAKVGNLLLDTPGIGDYSNLLLNNNAANILLNDEEIAVLGLVTLEV